MPYFLQFSKCTETHELEIKLAVPQASLLTTDLIFGLRETVHEIIVKGGYGAMCEELGRRNRAVMVFETDVDHLMSPLEIARRLVAAIPEAMAQSNQQLIEDFDA